jgi:hypothetical protein
MDDFEDFTTDKCVVIGREVPYGYHAQNNSEGLDKLLGIHPLTDAHYAARILREAPWHLCAGPVR